MAKKVGAPSKHTPEQQAAFRERWDGGAGEKRRDLADEAGVTYQTMGKYLKPSKAKGNGKKGTPRKKADKADKANNSESPSPSPPPSLSLLTLPWSPSTLKAMTADLLLMQTNEETRLQSYKAQQSEEIAAEHSPDILRRMIADKTTRKQQLRKIHDQFAKRVEASKTEADKKPSSLREKKPT